MLTQQTIPTTSRVRWRAVVERHAAAAPEPQVRRRNRRYATSHGNARLLFILDCAGRKLMQRWNAPLLQVSDDGLMVRTHRELPPHIGVAVQVSVDGETLTLMGRLAHCTSTVGGYKAGIELRFAD